MDVVSHALVGVLVAMAAGVRLWRHRAAMGLVAAAPDAPVAIVYLLLGRAHDRPFWIPLHSDWEGVRAAHPVWSALWEAPHSLLFLALVVVPLVLHFRLPRVAIAAYASHLLLDLPTHTGEWAVAPLYPLPWRVEGWTDAWAWPPLQWAASWAVLLALVLLVDRWLRRRAPEAI